MVLFLRLLNLNLPLLLLRFNNIAHDAVLAVLQRGYIRKKYSSCVTERNRCHGNFTTYRDRDGTIGMGRGG